MARIARVIAVGYPHHLTQRGNRCLPTFFSDEDYVAYLDLVAEWCAKHAVQIWAYCLMPNHVHLVAVPHTAEGLARAVGEAHRRYTRRINFREGWRGYLWQGRFASFPMERAYALAAVRYVERNPVRAGLVAKAWKWPWSSAVAHVAGEDDALVRVAPLREEIHDWRKFLTGSDDEEELAVLRRHARTGRPWGGATFLARLGQRIGRSLVPGHPGRPRKEK